MERFVLRRRSAWQAGLLVLAVTGLILMGVGSASAATLTVCPSGCPYTTIQDALDAASNGDKIAIGPGTYDGGFTISKSVKLDGAGAASTTISVRDTDERPAVRIASGASVVIGGVTLTSGRPSRGIENDGSLKLNDSAVTPGHDPPYYSGGGIGNGDAATLTLNDSAVSFFGPGGEGIENDGGTVTLNASTVGGGALSQAYGITNDLGGTLTLKESTVSGIGGDGTSGGISSRGTVTLTDSIVSHNGGSSGGFGIRNGGTMTLKKSTVSGNGGGAFGVGILNGGFGYEGGTLKLKESTVSGNGGFDTGFGILNGRFGFNGGTVTLLKSTVSGNYGDNEGGGIGNRGTVTLTKSTVSSNSTGGSGGGIYNYDTGSLTLKKSTVSYNSALIGGGILNSGMLTLKKAVFSANTPDDCSGC